MSEREPPQQIWYELEAALLLLADLEEANEALVVAGHLATVVGIENQIHVLSRELDFDEPEEDRDGRASSST